MIFKFRMLFFLLPFASSFASDSIDVDCVKAISITERKFFPVNWYKNKNIFDVRCAKSDQVLTIFYTQTGFYGLRKRTVIYKLKTMEIIVVTPKRRAR
jgi:hypothetical protein